MKKKFLEGGIALLLILLAAGGAFYWIILAPPQTDIFPGRVLISPVSISAPVYGQILSFSVKEGEQVKTGQLLFTLWILNKATLPPEGSIYHIQQDKILVKSPEAGIVEQIHFSALSTVGGAQEVMTLYTGNTLTLAILFPQGSTASAYSSFFASDGTEKSLLTLQRMISPALVPGVPFTTTVYEASCSECESFLAQATILVYAQKKQAPPPPIVRFFEQWIKG